MSRFFVLLAVIPLLTFAQQKSKTFPDAYLPGDGVQPPALKFSTLPNYTEQARNAALEGNVLLRVVVSEEGNVEDVLVVRSLNPGLDQEAIETVRHWSFRPATLQDHPVRSMATVQVKFDLKRDQERWPRIQVVPESDSSISLPELTYFADAFYTQEAIDAQIHGDIGLELTVNADGVPTDVRVIEALDPALDQASVKAAKRWRFRPMTDTGNSSPMKLRANISFKYKPPSSDLPPRIGKDVTPPSVLYQIEPHYTEEAIKLGMQGMVGIAMVVDEAGLPTKLKVTSPLGHGLDENAMEAVKKWRFDPGQRDGKPVPVQATIQVTFKLKGHPFDAKAEQRRFQYNLHLHSLETGTVLDAPVLALRSMAEENFGPAMVAYSRLLQQGYAMERREGEAEEWILAAADEDEIDAMVEAARMYLSGDGTKQDFKKGRQLLEKAAKDHNNPDAQYFLGRAYESGTNGFDVDTDDAVKYYRMCSSATMLCQLGAGRSLLHKKKRRDKNLTEAVAWLELAAEQDSQEARDLLAQEVPNLSSDLRRKIEERKTELAGSE